MAYTPTVSPSDSSPMEIVKSGSRVDITIHTGTSFQIREGTWADYHSQELTQDSLGHKSADIYAIEGEWKIVQSNENNLLVTDVASFPIQRTAQYCGSNDNGNYNTHEVPHHHMAPKTLVGTSQLVWSSAVSNVYGLTTHGDYAFFHRMYSATDRAVVRLNLPTMGTNELTDVTLRTMGYTFADFEFIAIDDNTVMITIENIAETSGQYWATYNFSTAILRIICLPFPGKYPYAWHWAIIGNYLCISAIESKSLTYSPYTSYYSFRNYMYDLAGNLVLGQTFPGIKNWGNLQYPACNDVIIGKRYFVEWHFGTTDPPAGYDNDARLIVFNTEKDGPSVSTVYPRYLQAGESGLGCNQMYHLIENPFNHMLYYIAEHSYQPGATYSIGISIQIMSSDYLSNGTLYEYTYLQGTSPNYALMPAVLIPGMFEAYAIMANGDVYNVRDISSQIGTPIFTLPSLWEVYRNGGFFVNDWDMPQPDKLSACLDRWDRLWYVDGSYIKAVNIKTGSIEVSLDAGIPNINRGQYCYPYYEAGFQHVYLARDRVLVLAHCKGYCGSRFSNIYNIE